MLNILHYPINPIIIFLENSGGIVKAVKYRLMFHYKNI